MERATEEELRQLKNDLAGYEEQLRGVQKDLNRNPRNGELQEMKRELEEVITLTQDLIKQSAGSTQQPVQQSSKQVGGIAQVANKITQQVLVEYQGWKVGDKCRTVWLDDGKKYSALITSFKPETRSAVVTFIRYLNQQDTPIDFLERTVPDEEELAQPAESETKDPDRKRKGTESAPVILTTDTPEIIAKKKRMLKKMKRESKQAEKEKEYERKTNSWKSFQETAKKKGREGMKETSIFKSTQSTKSIGVSEVTEKSQYQDAGIRKKWVQSKNIYVPTGKEDI